MASFKVSGGKPLYGSVRLGGAKNASYKLMIASLLAQSESRLLNFSHISDVQMVAEIIESLGGQAQKRGERTLFIDPQGITKSQVDQQYGERSRAAPMFIPPLLHRFGQVTVPMPGGDKLGKRPLDWHFKAMEQMGAKITQTNTEIHAEAKNGLKGISFRFPKNSHTGTENLIMAGVRAEGKTVIENAALEPEVDDLINYLNNCGARIRRRHHRVIEIYGVNELFGSIHQIVPDRNEAVSYACAAIATKGDIIVENARADHLEAFLDKLAEIGAGYEIGNYGIRFYYKGPLRSADIVTQPEPGFMTDWQPLWAVLITQAEGESVIHEAVYTSRFQYVDHLKQMGAAIEYFNPQVDNPDKVYNFNLAEDVQDSRHAIKIKGPVNLKPGEFKVTDLRHGATMVIAAMTAKGTSYIHNIEQVDRGYEDLDGRLRSMGANIVRQA